MNILFGAIPVIAFMVLLGYKKSDKFSNKVICMQLPFVVIGIIAFWFYMIKCYEVPIHHNRISYMLMTNNTDYSYFTGNTAIDIVYDYNRQKGLKELSYGYPKDTKPRVEIESYIEGHRKAEKPQFFSSTPSLKIHKGDTINYDEMFMDGMCSVISDTSYISYLQGIGADPNVGDSNHLDGTLMIVDINSSNRQLLYPLSVFRSQSSKEIQKDTFTISDIQFDDITEAKTDTIWLRNRWNLFLPGRRTFNSTRNFEYIYAPKQDSVIYQFASITRTDYSSPNVFLTAEDLSRAVEVFWVDGLMGDTLNNVPWQTCIKLKSLSFDYIGPAEFSEMYPEPDKKDVSKVTFTDRAKLDYIVNNGLRFHVKLPDMENIQQVRIFAVTMVLTGLLGILTTLCYRLIIRNWEWLKKKCHISKRLAYILYFSLIAILVIIIVAVVIHSHVDAFDLDDDKAWTIFNCIK